MLSKLKANMPYIIMVLPAFIIFFVFFLIPVFMTIHMSMTNASNFTPNTEWVGLDNYKAAFNDKTIQRGILNSLWYSFATVFFINIIALPVAVVLNSKMRGRTAFRAIFFSPAVLSVLVVGYLWSFILSSSDTGLLNRGLSLLGIDPINFLGDSKLAMWSVIFTQVWQWFGYSMVIYLANLQSIPLELYEAASLDGASRWRSFFHITLPGLLPALQICFITSTISGLKVFDIIFSLTKGGPGYATETVLTLMYGKFSQGRFGYAASFGILFLIVTLIISAIMLGLFRKMEKRLS